MRAVKVNWARAILQELRKSGVRGAIANEDEIIITSEQTTSTQKTVDKVVERFRKMEARIPRIRYISK